MKNEIIVSGTQTFMGKNIPIILGGFGADKKCLTDKTIAEIHNMQTRHIREIVNNNSNRFILGKDIIDLIVVGQTDDNFLTKFGYSKMEIAKANHLYLFSERGYARLIKAMDSDLAWDIHEKLVDEYFTMRDEVIPTLLDSFIALSTDNNFLKNRISNMESVLSNMISVGFAAQNEPEISYVECLPSTTITNHSYKELNEKANYLVNEVKEYANFNSEKEVFSRIYKLMTTKYGINLEQCRQNYILKNNSRGDISVWTVITSNSVLFHTFCSIAEKMIMQLKTYGSNEEYIIAQNFDEALEQLKLLAYNKYNCCWMSICKKVYKHMENTFSVDWHSIKAKNKLNAIRNNSYLQECFIKVVTYLQYEETEE